MLSTFRLVLLLSSIVGMATAITNNDGHAVNYLGQGQLQDVNGGTYTEMLLDSTTNPSWTSGSNDVVGNPYTNDPQGCHDYCYTTVTPLYTDLVGFSFYGGTPQSCRCFQQVSSASPVETDGDFTFSSGYGSLYCFNCIPSEPSLMPSEAPSLVPSEGPSEIPSLMPSESPSLVPSEGPSEIPSSMPSEAPSSMPSEGPSEIPSSMPSEAPSSMPSEGPSEVPSSMPSEAPSSMPSSIPSRYPSSMPSESPSLVPSPMPSGQPSSMPSGRPTSQPSESPSAQPSCTPSSAPTDPETMFLFYPNWDPVEAGCKNDGKHPPYMEANPRDYLMSTLAVCCKTYFGWNYDACVGKLRGTCSRALFYPDFEGDNEGCVDDGNEPAYMTDNHVDYMFSQLDDCCTTFFNWNFDECAGATSSANVGMYYPDFDDDANICKNNGNQPKYMNSSPTSWMHDTLAACCKTNYQWNYDACDPSNAASSGGTSSGSSGTSSGSSGTSSGMVWYYPDWAGSENICRNDGNQPQYMINTPLLWMHDNLRGCCEHHYGWNYDVCMSSGTAPATATTPATATGKYFMNWTLTPYRCSVDGGVEGTAKSWDELYDTLRECCSERNWWNDACD